MTKWPTDQPTNGPSHQLFNQPTNKRGSFGSYTSKNLIQELILFLLLIEIQNKIIVNSLRALSHQLFFHFALRICRELRILLLFIWRVWWIINARIEMLFGKLISHTENTIHGSIHISLLFYLYFFLELMYSARLQGVHKLWQH